MNAEGDGRAYVGDAQVDEQLGRGGSDQKTAVPLICVFSASCRHPVPSLDQGQKHPVLMDTSWPLLVPDKLIRYKGITDK